MENQGILNLLNDANDSEFVTRKWNIVNDPSKINYNATNEITYNTEVLKFNFCDYNDAHILVKAGICVTAAPEIEAAFKNCAAFTKCITKIDGTTIDDAEYLDLVMLMYSLIEYCSNYSEATGSLWFCSKDEATDFNAVIDDNNNFKYKAKLAGNTVAQPALNNANETLKNASIAVPAKYLINFWRSLAMLLIDCKLELKLNWTKYCVLSAAYNGNSVNNNGSANNIIFTIKDTK